jgi:aspartyl-tRNA(Asn)/glutamyl-tRNA(Gln) amidotransferase subunit B
MNETGATIDDLKVEPEQLAALVDLRQKDIVNTTAAKQVLEEIFESGEEPQAVVDRLGLAQISDTDALSTVVAKVIEENPKQVGQYLDGKHAVIGWFIGQVMKATRGKANPQEARTLLQKQLERLRSDK